jgi:peptide/nickel transport system substrate-binding protein
MTRRDDAVVGVLVLLFAVIVAAVGAPAAAGPAAAPAASVRPVAAFYREGIVGRPTSISPLSARNQADRDLVALVFSGLVRLGPEGVFAPDLAATWTMADDGRTWTFDLREDAAWHDGTPVTAADVVFTVETLRDPAYTGPGSFSWEDVVVTALDERTVRFELTTPLGGFLQAATQPIVPAHLLRDIPVASLADQPFGQQPVGSGPFALESLDDLHAALVPAALATPEAPEPTPTAPPRDGPAVPTDSIATPVPSTPPLRPVPGLPGIEIRFYDDAAALEAAYRAGTLDAATGLGPGVAKELGALPGNRLLRYPGSRLTAVVFNLRPGQPAFRDSAVRRALLQAIDRDAIVESVYHGLAARADGLIPPASWAFDVGAAAPVAPDPSAAATALGAAGWTRRDDGWAAPSASAALTFELLSPNEASNPTTYAVAAAVAADWRALGLSVTHVALPAAELTGERLRTGEFSAAVIDMSIGLDPDLYPLLASTQATSRGLNLSGVQDAALDQLLVAARGPGTHEARKEAYRALQAYLTERQYLLPLDFRELVVVARDTLAGPSIRQVDDAGGRFWDVLTWRLANGR